MRILSINFLYGKLVNYMGFPCGSAGKESSCNVGDLGLIPGLGRSPGEGIGYPLQYSGQENSWTNSYSIALIFLFLLGPSLVSHH